MPKKIHGLYWRLRHRPRASGSFSGLSGSAGESGGIFHPSFFICRNGLKLSAVGCIQSLPVGHRH